jgi:hypothetical protein
MPSIIKVRHYGLPFINSSHAKLIFSGVLHHYILVR